LSVLGKSAEWSDLIDTLVPEILSLVVASWQEMAPPGPDAKEDDITIALCRALTQNRTVRGLMFQVRTQVVELNPMHGEDLGRLDIAFIPLVPREDIYFCLESKRLNVVKNGKLRTYATEYVTLGMIRFVKGQYSHAVQHGGMIGYVLNGNISDAITNVATNIETHYAALCMTGPGVLQSSTILEADTRARETHHKRAHEKTVFRIHHLFMAG
jgi:hypothetical protein